LEKVLATPGRIPEELHGEVPVDPGNGDMRPDATDEEENKSKNNLKLELRDR
jgi:hypothetical protein